ncbi:MAG: polysaccharide pyruvyl transferase family protein [Candidatus Eisenbacteria bacterium]|nr:polysaccharide pyruvyl transferase family protein [Candidatus Eisenbacteria bacterium]
MQPNILHVHASCHNVGDYLLVSQLRGALRGALASEVQFTSITPRREGALDPREWIDQTALLGGRLEPGMESRLSQASLAVIGGGDLLTGRASFRLFRVLAALGLPLYFLGVGVNMQSVRPRMRRPLLRELRKARLIVTREEASTRALTEAGLSNVRSGVDLSVLLHAKEPARGVVTASSPCVAVSLRAPERNTARWGQTEYQAIASALDRLIREDGARVELVSMTGPVGAAGNDDIPVLRTVRDLMDPTLHDSTSVDAVPQEPEAAVQYLARFDVLVGMRLHALALASLAGVPVVPFAYSPKIDSWWAQFGLGRSSGIPESGDIGEGSDVHQSRGTDAIGGSDVVRGPLAPGEWSSPERIVEAVRLALHRSPNERDVISRSYARQDATARAHISEAAALMSEDLQSIGSGSNSVRGLGGYRLQTRCIEPLRDVLERILARL